MTFLLLLCVAILTAAGQVCIRIGAPRIRTPGGFRSILISAFNLPLVAGLSLAMIAPLLYFQALKTVPLGFAHAVTAITHLLVLIGARFALGERLNRKKLSGAVLIVAGLIIWGLV